MTNESAPKGLLARFTEDDTRDAVQCAVGPDVAVHVTPPCSCCNAVIAYARDRRALWIFPQLWPTTLPPDATPPTTEEIYAAMTHTPKIMGFEALDELERFLGKLSGKNHYDTIAPILRKAFAEGAN